MKRWNFLQSLVAFWLKGSAEVDSKWVNIKYPNTILKLIPLGQRNISQPVNQISSISTSFSLDFKNLIIGILVFFISIALFSTSFLVGLVLFLLSINSIVNSFLTNLEIRTTSGTTVSIPFIVFQKNIAEEIGRSVNSVVSDYLDNTNAAKASMNSAQYIVENLKR